MTIPICNYPIVEPNCFFYQEDLNYIRYCRDSENVERYQVLFNSYIKELQGSCFIKRVFDINFLLLKDSVHPFVEHLVEDAPQYRMEVTKRWVCLLQNTIKRSKYLLNFWKTIISRECSKNGPVAVTRNNSMTMTLFNVYASQAFSKIFKKIDPLIPILFEKNTKNAFLLKEALIANYIVRKLIKFFKTSNQTCSTSVFKQISIHFIKQINLVRDHDHGLQEENKDGCDVIISMIFLRSICPHILNHAEGDEVKLRKLIGLNKIIQQFGNKSDLASKKFFNPKRDYNHLRSLILDFMNK